MGNVNIFGTIKTVTSRIEPLHSQYLADALSESLTGDRALFDGFWRLAAPQGWDVPKQAVITTEDSLGRERGRIDVCINTTNPPRALGVEVKTTDSSATEGQLQRYLDGLKETHSDRAVSVAYLTPFNRKRAGEFASQLPTVEEHDRFSGTFPDSRHVSWLDVAEIPTDDSNELWQQHRDFVVSEISSYEKLRTRSERDRSFKRVLRRCRSGCVLGERECAGHLVIARSRGTRAVGRGRRRGGVGACFRNVDEMR